MIINKVNGRSTACSGNNFGTSAVEKGGGTNLLIWKQFNASLSILFGLMGAMGLWERGRGDSVTINYVCMRIKLSDSSYIKLSFIESQ